MTGIEGHLREGRRPRASTSRVQGADQQPAPASRRSSPSTCCSSPPAAVRSPKASAPRSSASRWIAATSSSIRCSRPTCPASPRSATSSRWAGRTTSSRTSRRWKASCSPSASPVTHVQPINYDHVPRCTYTEPEIGSVGLTEAQAKEQGHDVRIGSVPVPRAGPRPHGRRDRRLREDRRREEVRRDPRRAHHRPARHRAGGRSGDGAAHGSARSKSWSRPSTRTRRCRRRWVRPRMPRTARRYIFEVLRSWGLEVLKSVKTSRPKTSRPEDSDKGFVMSTPVVMPQMGESIAEGTIVRWIKKVGDSVDRDEPLFEISTDKVDAEIPSPAAGVADRDRREGRRDGPGQQRRGDDRRRGRGEAGATAARGCGACAPPTAPEHSGRRCDRTGATVPLRRPPSTTNAALAAPALRHPAPRHRKRLGRSSASRRRWCGASRKEHNVDIVADPGIGHRRPRHQEDILASSSPAAPAPRLRWPPPRRDLPRPRRNR